MNFENIIRKEAAAMGLTYKYGPLPYLNQVLDALLHGNDAPACLNIQPVDGTYSFDETPLYRRGRETQRTKVAMSRKIALDYDPQKVAELTDELKGLGVSLLTRRLARRSPAFQWRRMARAVPLRAGRRSPLWR